MTTNERVGARQKGGRPRNPDIEPGSYRARGRTIKDPDPAPATLAQQLLAEMKRRGQEPGDRLKAFVRGENVDGSEYDLSRAYGDAHAMEQVGRAQGATMLSDGELAAV